MAAFFRNIRQKKFSTCLVLGLACHFAPLPAQSVSANASSQAQAKKIYAVQCAACHGAEARGGEYGPVLAGNSD
ncbi:MAG TPA: c-type cytochrome, partial [Acidobacteriaceae bacterium]|nr:c-type cytochrome [Acidobacteriaceae bacterium]